jgi:hypothetical protein
MKVDIRVPERFEDAIPLALKTEEGASRQCRVPLGAGRGKEVNFLLEPSEKPQCY